MAGPFVSARKLALILVCLFSAALLQAQTPAPAASSSVSEPIKIGFLMDSLKIERWQTDVDTFQARAKQLGAVTMVETAEGNDDLQLQQAKKLLDAGVKVLVVVAHDTSQAAAIVSLAKSRSVPVVSYDRLIPSSDVAFFVGVDYREVGRLQASYLVRLAPKGNYVLLEGSPTDSNAHLLRQGQKDVLQPYVDRGDIKIVGDVWCVDWNPLEAYTHMLQIIGDNHGQIAAVVASNDGTATGAVQALQENKLAGKVFVSGQDADLVAVLRLLQGTQSMTVYKSVFAMATDAANVAVALANGQQPTASGTVVAGDRTIPAIFAPAIDVDKDNIMATVIKDGFQNLDTIKKSLPPSQWPKQ